MDIEPSDRAIKVITIFLSISDIFGILGILMLYDIIVNWTQIKLGAVILISIMLIMLVFSSYCHIGLISREYGDEGLFTADAIKGISCMLVVLLMQIIGVILAYNMITNNVPIKDELIKLIASTVLLVISSIGLHDIVYKIIRL